MTLRFSRGEDIMDTTRPPAAAFQPRAGPKWVFRLLLALKSPGASVRGTVVC